MPRPHAGAHGRRVQRQVMQRSAAEKAPEKTQFRPCGRPPDLLRPLARASACVHREAAARRGSSVGSVMARLQIHPVGLGVIIFAFVVWVIALGGCGGATYACQTTNQYAYCAKQYQWEWWSLWLEFALLLALFITCFLEAAFKRGQLVFLAYFVIATVCVMLSAHNFITQMQLGPVNIRDLGQDAVNAASAGYVLLGLANFILIIILGKDFGVQPANQYQQASGMQFQTSAPV